MILLFDTPQTIRKIGVEVEELAVGRTQELSVFVSSDGGRTYQELDDRVHRGSPCAILGVNELTAGTIGSFNATTPPLSEIPV